MDTTSSSSSVSESSVSVIFNVYALQLPLTAPLRLFHLLVLRFFLLSILGTLRCKLSSTISDDAVRIDRISSAVSFRCIQSVPRWKSCLFWKNKNIGNNTCIGISLGALFGRRIALITLPGLQNAVWLLILLIHRPTGSHHGYHPPGQAKSRDFAIK